MGLLKCVVKPTHNSHPRIIPLKSPLLGLGTVGAGYCWGGVEVRSLYPGLVGIHCAVFLYGIVSAGRSRLILFLEIIYETCLWGAVHRTGKRVRSK